jgi:hypothetical protein
MNFLTEIVRCGLLLIPEIFRWYRAGAISHARVLRALLGRIAQDAADSLPDEDPKRDRLLDYVSDVEDWFQSTFSAQSDLAFKAG